MNKTLLQLLFGAIFLTLLAGTVWASLHQPVWEWQGLTREPDRGWTIATMLDAYGGFLTFYAWLHYKEQRWSRRVGWFVAIMLLGNMAMSAYVLRQLARLRPDEPAATILAARTP
ncbi:MAG: DUF1475 family protein [Steroidobacteraceae bacterium]